MPRNRDFQDAETRAKPPFTTRVSLGIKASVKILHASVCNIFSMVKILSAGEAMAWHRPQFRIESLPRGHSPTRSLAFRLRLRSSRGRVAPSRNIAAANDPDHRLPA